jgi:hypothetical protein
MAPQDGVALLAGNGSTGQQSRPQRNCYQEVVCIIILQLRAAKLDSFYRRRVCYRGYSLLLK